MEGLSNINDDESVIAASLPRTYSDAEIAFLSAHLVRSATLPQLRHIRDYINSEIEASRDYKSALDVETHPFEEDDEPIAYEKPTRNLRISGFGQVDATGNRSVENVRSEFYRFFRPLKAESCNIPIGDDPEMRFVFVFVYHIYLHTSKHNLVLPSHVLWMQKQQNVCCNKIPITTFVLVTQRMNEKILLTFDFTCFSDASCFCSINFTFYFVIFLLAINGSARSLFTHNACWGYLT